MVRTINKKDVRRAFRNAVFARDDYRCRVCGVDAHDCLLDAHHVTDRADMPNGGYVIENGISLCEACHLKAEVWHASGHTRSEPGYHPDDLYRLIGSCHDAAWKASESVAQR